MKRRECTHKKNKSFEAGHICSAAAHGIVKKNFRWEHETYDYDVDTDCVFACIYVICPLVCTSMDIFTDILLLSNVLCKN